MRVDPSRRHGILITSRISASMKMFSYLVKSLLIGLASATIPSGINFCPKRHPNLNQCMISNVQKALPQISDGVPEWGLPTINPLRIPEVEVANQDTFTARIRNASIYGLQNLVVKSIDMHLDEYFLTAETFIPSINVTGEYDGFTTILVKLAGKGPITAVTKKINAFLRIHFGVVQRKSGNFIFLKSVTVKLDIEEAQFHYESYENPGGPLDEGINTALNDDPKGVLKAMGPCIENAIATQTLTIGNEFCKHYPYDVLFADRE